VKRLLLDPHQPPWQPRRRKRGVLRRPTRYCRFADSQHLCDLLRSEKLPARHRHIRQSADSILGERFTCLTSLTCQQPPNAKPPIRAASGAWGPSHAPRSAAPAAPASQRRNLGDCATVLASAIRDQRLVDRLQRRYAGFRRDFARRLRRTPLAPCRVAPGRSWSVMLRLTLDGRARRTEAAHATNRAVMDLRN